MEFSNKYFKSNRGSSDRFRIRTFRGYKVEIQVFGLKQLAKRAKKFNLFIEAFRRPLGKFVVVSQTMFAHMSTYIDIC